MIKDNVNLYDGRADAFLGCRKWHHVYTRKRRGERQGQAIAGQRQTIDQPDAESLLCVGGKNNVVRRGLATERHDVSHTIHFCVLRSMRPEVGVVLITDLMVQIIIALMLQLVVATSGHT
jgi:hypothetical protein